VSCATDLLNLGNTFRFETHCLSKSNTGKMLIIVDPRGERKEMSRTTIKVPGFTAEASLFTSSENHRSKVRYPYPASAHIVVPRMRQTCFQACKLAGNSDDMCHRHCNPYDPPVSRFTS
jgi:hypothetical protein